MKQKLAVARALLHRPSLVFLDEPTSGLDPVAAAALRDDLAALATQEGVTIALTTHNLAEAEKLCTLVGVIREGKLIALGHPDDLRSRRSNERVTILGRGFDQHVLDVLRVRPEIVAADLQNGRLVIDLVAKANTAPLVSVLVNAGAEIEQVRRDQASLEDVFLTLMEEGQQ
jgi:ABC-2 type transport system ATP-binding protein